MAQEPQIIGGYLLDGKDSFEELEAAILTESKWNKGCDDPLYAVRTGSVARKGLLRIVESLRKPTGHWFVRWAF